MNQTQEQTKPKSWNVEARSYHLDSLQVMEVVADLEHYVNLARAFSEPNRATPSVTFHGEGRRLVVHGEKRVNDSIVQGCNLVELVLIGADHLRLHTFEQEGITVDPTRLYEIGKKYTIGE